MEETGNKFQQQSEFFYEHYFLFYNDKLLSLPEGILCLCDTDTQRAVSAVEKNKPTTPQPHPTHQLELHFSGADGNRNSNIKFGTNTIILEIAW